MRFLLFALLALLPLVCAGCGHGSAVASNRGAAANLQLGSF